MLIRLEISRPSADILQELPYSLKIGFIGELDLSIMGSGSQCSEVCVNKTLYIFTKINNGLSSIYCTAGISKYHWNKRDWSLEFPSFC